MSWITEDEFRMAVQELHRRAEQKVPSPRALASPAECRRSWERFHNQFRSLQRMARRFDWHADVCDRESGFPCDCFRSWGFPFEEVGDVSEAAGAYP